MGARNNPTDQEEVKKDVNQEEQSIVELEINLTLLNNKLNYIIAKLDQLQQK